MSSVAKTLADMGSRMPGWSVVVLFMVLFVLLVGGRMLDLSLIHI